MNIPFLRFEQFIDETILKRGLSYFKSGYVREPDELSSGDYETIVEGSEDYTVRLTIKNETVTAYSCTCPYDLGPVCKHVVAVLFYLQQDELDLKPASAKKKSAAPKEKKKTVSQQVNELLEKISHDDLKKFILTNIERNPPFRNIFLSSFAQHNSAESKEMYAKQVRSILNSAAGRHGFIEYSQARGLGKAVYDLLAVAQKHVENKNHQSAFFIACAVMEEMTRALDFADDSDGDIGGNIDNAFEILHNIAVSNPPEPIRSALFNYCIESIRSNIFSGWDWHLSMMHLASEIITNPEDAALVISLLDKKGGSEYEFQKAQEIKLHIIQKFGSAKEAEQFLEQNLVNPAFRKTAIDKAVNDKNYEKAIAIANDGIQLDLKNKPGLAMDWYDCLLRIAILQNDTEKIISYARFLFLHSMQQKQQYYMLMKNNVAPGDWNIFVELIIVEITKRTRYPDVYAIAQIYVNEQWWDRLLQLVENNVSLSMVEEYEKYLSKDFSSRLTELYESEILKYLQHNAARNHYQTACRYLRRITKLGAPLKTKYIIENLRKLYPQRKALLEELNKV